MSVLNSFGDRWYHCLFSVILDNFSEDGEAGKSDKSWEMPGLSSFIRTFSSASGLGVSHGSNHKHDGIPDSIKFAELVEKQGPRVASPMPICLLSP